MFGTEPDEVERQLSQWAQGFAGKAERFGAMRAQVEQSQVAESSPDGAVRVTIDSSGVPIDLTLTAKISGMAPSEIAALVMTCMRRAQQQLAGQVQQAMAATVGAEEPVVEHVVSGYRQRFGEDQQDHSGPDPGVLALGVLDVGEIDDDSPQRPIRRHRPAPGADEEDFGDRNYLR